MGENRKGGTAMEAEIAQALRYLGVKADPDGAVERELSQVSEELAQAVQPRYVYRVFSIAHQPDGVMLKECGILLTGRSAEKMLGECRQAVLLLCTLGARFETMLRAAQARDMAKAVMLDACASALVEAGCDAAEKEIAARFPGLYLTDRFSPGYGDLPLALQPAICGALDGWRRLGVQVTESLLMNPSKSVTAVIGLSDRPQAARVRGCEYCSMAQTCTLCKGGKRCGI